LVPLTLDKGTIHTYLTGNDKLKILKIADDRRQRRQTPETPDARHCVPYSRSFTGYIDTMAMEYTFKIENSEPPSL
jgi:hypothetical protein